ALQSPSGPQSGRMREARDTHACERQSSQNGQLDTHTQTKSGLPHPLVASQLNIPSQLPLCGSKWPSPSASTSVRKKSPSSTTCPSRVIRCVPLGANTARIPPPPCV